MRKTVGEITPAELREMQNFIAAKSGLNFQRYKTEDLLAALNERLSELPHFEGFQGYFENLRRAAEDGRELRTLLSRLTVGETYFLRNRPQFSVLRDYLVPDLVKRKRELGMTLGIWSAGCSTGEEPYSLAILLREILPDFPEWKITILATDINEDAIAAAREGLYRKWAFREVEEEYRQRFFFSGERRVASET